MCVFACECVCVEGGTVVCVCVCVCLKELCVVCNLKCTMYVAFGVAKTRGAKN